MKNRPFIIKHEKYSRYGLLVFLLVIFIHLHIAYSNPLEELIKGTVKIGVRYDQFNQPDFKQALATFSLQRPISFFSERSMLNKLSLFKSEAGNRFFSGGSSEFAGRAQLLDVDVANQSLMMGATLFDLNKTGFLENETRLAAGRIGFVLLSGDESTNFIVKIFGTAGQSKWTLGAYNYNEMGVSASDEFSGLETGYQGGLSTNFHNQFSLNFDFSNRIMLVDPELNLTTVSANVSYNLNPKRKLSPEVFIGYIHQRAKIKDRNLSQKNFQIHGGVRIILQ